MSEIKRPQAYRKSRVEVQRFYFIENVQMQVMAPLSSGVLFDLSKVIFIYSCPLPYEPLGFFAQAIATQL